MSARLPTHVRLRRGVLLAAALFVMGAGITGPAAAGGGKYDRAHRNTERLAKELKAAKAQYDALQRELQDLETQISQVQAQRAEVERQIAKTRKVIAESVREHEELQGKLDERARAAYIRGPSTAVALVLSARSLSDLTDRVSYLDALSRSDAGIAAGVEATKETLQARRLQFGKLRRQLSALLKELNEKNEALLAKQKEQAAVLADLKDKLQEAKKIEAKLAARFGFAVVPGGGPFRVCPVDRPRSYIDDFGAPRYAGGYHPHAGNDMFAPLGTPIRAPFDGTASVSSNGLGGNAVSVYSPAGHVYNAHLSRFGNLGHVSAGTIIGYVGNTGDAQGTAYHDHFEWHPNQMPANPYKSAYGYTQVGDAVDPYPYLNAVCGVGGG